MKSVYYLLIKNFCEYEKRHVAKGEQTLLQLAQTIQFYNTYLTLSWRLLYLQVLKGDLPPHSLLHCSAHTPILSQAPLLAIHEGSLHLLPANLGIPLSVNVYII